MSRRAPTLACAALLLLVAWTGDAQLCVGDCNSDGTTRDSTATTTAACCPRR